MHAGGGESEDRVASFEIGARQKLGALHGANRESSEIVIAGGVQPRHLGGLAADECASGLAAAFGDAGDDALGHAHIELAGGEIIEKEERLGALAPVSMASLSLVPTPSVAATRSGSLKPQGLRSNRPPKPPMPPKRPVRAVLAASGPIEFTSALPASISTPASR
jgi:hypothetical protein